MQAGASGAAAAGRELGDVPVTVRRIRSTLGLSQEQFAHRLGVSFATVNRWERGHAEPSPRSRAMLARLRAEATGAGSLGAAYSLPPDRTSFLGRERELAELGTLWPPNRLVTLTGPGGIGKSRLAVELLRRAEPTGRRAVVVQLDLVSDRTLVASAIGAALGLRHRGGSDVETEAAGVVRTLQGLAGVLLLDSCEHVAGSVRTLLDRVFAVDTPLRVLATSRIRLDVAGEQVWPVPPLRLPDPGQPRGEAEQADAVRLFVARSGERAAAVPTGATGWRSLVALCRRLDGVPVALELAAGWMPTLTPAELLGRLAGGTDLLAEPGPTGGRDGTPRAAIEWSAALLAAADRALVVQLAVLVGPFTVEDAAAVAGPGADLAGSIRRLVEVSWLEPLPDDPDGEPVRWFRMLDPLRGWALSVLDDLDAGAMARRRLAAHVRELGRKVDTREWGDGTAGWPQRLERRAGSIQAALAALAGTGPPDPTAPDLTTPDPTMPHPTARDPAVLGAEIAVSLLRWWQRSGRIAEGRHWLQLFAARVGGPLRARAWCAAACLAMETGDYEPAARLARDALGVLDGIDPQWAGRARTVAGGVAKYRGDVAAARAELETALALHRTHGDPFEIALTLDDLGSLAAQRNDLAAAEACYAESLELKHQVGEDRSTAATMGSLADLYRRRQHPDLAREVLEAARAIATKIGDQVLLSFVDINLGEVLLDLAEPREAGDHFRHALDTAQATGARRWEALALCGIGRALLAAGRRRQATRILQDSLALATSVGDPVVLAEARAALAGLGGDARPARPPGGLSPRQTEVLGWLAAGLSDREIAGRLGIRTSTVQRHVANVYQKLGVQNRAEATDYALAHGIGHRPPAPGGPGDRGPPNEVLGSGV